jgi:hypothetical protein
MPRRPFGRNGVNIGRCIVELAGDIGPRQVLFSSGLSYSLVERFIAAVPAEDSQI